jgi:hypothetical protein
MTYHKSKRMLNRLDSRLGLLPLVLKFKKYFKLAKLLLLYWQLLEIITPVNIDMKLMIKGKGILCITTRFLCAQYSSSSLHINLYQLMQTSTCQLWFGHRQQCSMSSQGDSYESIGLHQGLHRQSRINFKINFMN